MFERILDVVKTIAFGNKPQDNYSMYKPIQTSILDTVKTLAFLDKTCDPPKLIIWVAASESCYRTAYLKLKGMAQIEVVEHGDTHVERN